MKRFLTAMALCAAALPMTQAMAAEQCAARADMIKALGDKFHEAPAAVGMVNPKVVLEIFVSDKGTWTILATDTTGKSCVLSAGEGWQSAMTLAGMPKA
jgi:hypothetical protein